MLHPSSTSSLNLSYRDSSIDEKLCLMMFRKRGGEGTISLIDGASPGGGRVSINTAIHYGTERQEAACTSNR